MEYLYISHFTEQDFDEVIWLAGGRRYTDDPHVREQNCDYVVADSVIELKIIEEEPIAKSTKQQKLASLFRSDIKTVILNPLDLDIDGRQRYYQELATPIKTALKHASKQLSTSAKEVGASQKIAIIINNGLTMTTPEEFKDLAIARAKNDTSGIDVLIVGGIYYYSDTFDSYVITEFSDHSIRDSKDIGIVERLRNAWNIVIDDYMTRQIVAINLERRKGPIRDLFFELNGIRYVKPPIQWGKPSEFFGKTGRPREDSTGMDICPPVATVLPIFDIESYSHAKENIYDDHMLKNSLREYLAWAEQTKRTSSDKLHPIVLTPLNLVDLQTLAPNFTFDDLTQLALPKFQEDIKRTVDRILEFPDRPISLNYILVQVNEIGIDRVNDIAMISHDRIGLVSDKQEFLLKGERMKFEYAIVLASAYCLSREADVVYYVKNEDFKWK